MYFIACTIWILLHVVAGRWKRNGGHEKLEQLNMSGFEHDPVQGYNREAQHGKAGRGRLVLGETRR